MKKETKKIIAGVVAVGALAGGLTIAGDLAVETPNEKNTRFYNKLETSVSRLQLSDDESVGYEKIRVLYERRKNGDEPTIEEWLTVESEIDDLRMKKDTPILQKLDRIIETADARDPEYNEREINKL